MIGLPGNTKLYLATKPTDLRRSFDGLLAIVEGSFGRCARTGDLFIFLNRAGTQVRILFWERDGYCIVMKRLEQGTFRRLHASSENDVVTIDVGELSMLLEGIDAPVVRRRKRFVSPMQPAKDVLFT
jgi:transposase